MARTPPAVVRHSAELRIFERSLTAFEAAAGRSRTDLGREWGFGTEAPTFDNAAKLRSAMERHRKREHAAGRRVEGDFHNALQELQSRFITGSWNIP